MIIAFELYTIVELIILVPLLTFLIVFAYRIGKTLEIAIVEKYNRKIVNKNKEVIWENIKLSRELYSVQKDLLETQRKLKKELIE